MGMPSCRRDAIPLYNDNNNLFLFTLAGSFPRFGRLFRHRGRRFFFGVTLISAAALALGGVAAFSAFGGFGAFSGFGDFTVLSAGGRPLRTTFLSGVLSSIVGASGSFLSSVDFSAAFTACCSDTALSGGIALSAAISDCAGACGCSVPSWATIDFSAVGSAPGIFFLPSAILLPARFLFRPACLARFLPCVLPPILFLGMKKGLHLLTRPCSRWYCAYQKCDGK